jgi:hypothetical protein
VARGEELNQTARLADGAMAALAGVLLLGGASRLATVVFAGPFCSAWSGRGCRLASSAAAICWGEAV